MSSGLRESAHVQLAMVSYTKANLWWWLEEETQPWKKLCSWYIHIYIHALERRDAKCTLANLAGV